MKVIGIMALLLVGIVASTGLVAAFGGYGRSEEVQNAIDTGDYNSWKSAVENGLTEERFAQAQEGRQGRMQMHEGRDALRQAVDDNDYEAYLAAATDLGSKNHPMDEEDFDTLVLIHQARAEGNDDLVAQLHDELGLVGGFGEGGMRQGGMQGNMQGNMQGGMQGGMKGGMRGQSGSCMN